MDNVIAPRDTTSNGPEDDNDLIFKGLREDYPELKDEDDDVLMGTVQEGEFPDIKDPAEFRQMLHDAYVPKKAPTNFGAVTPQLTDAKPQGTPMWKSVGKGVWNIGSQIAHSYESPIDAVAESMNRGAFEKPVDELEAMPDYQGLIQRGYSPKIARHVIEQRVGTMQDLNTSNEAEAELGKGKAVEGIATYGSTAATMGLAGALNAPAAIASKVGSAISPLNVGLSDSAMEVLAQKGLAGAAKRAIEGAAGLMGYEAIKAASEGKSAGEILDAAVWGTQDKTKRSPLGMPATQGAFLVGIALPVAGKIIGGIRGKVVNLAQAIPRYIEQKGTKAAQAQIDALGAQASNFAEKFKSDWLRTRFEDIARANDGQPSTITAGILIKEVLGDDVLANAPASAILQLAEKIKMQRRYIGIDPGMGTTKPNGPIISPEGMMTMRDEMGLPEPDPLQVINMLSQSQSQGILKPGVDPMNPPVGGLAPDPTAYPLGGGPVEQPNVQPATLGEAGIQGNASRSAGDVPLPQDMEAPVREFMGTFDAWAPTSELKETPMMMMDPAFAPIEKDPMAPLDLSTAPAEPRLDYRPLTADPNELTLDRPQVTNPSDASARSNHDIILPSTKRGVDLKHTEGLDAAPAAKKSVIAPVVKKEPKTMDAKKVGSVVAPSKDYSPTKVNTAEEAIRKNKSTLETAAKDFNLTETENKKLKDRMGSVAPVSNKPLPYTPEKPNDFKMGSKEYFTHKLEHLRDAYKDMPNVSYADKTKSYGTPEGEAYRQNKRLSNWHAMVSANVELLSITDHIKDPKLRKEIGDEATSLLEDFKNRHDGKEENVMTTDAEVKRANDLIDKTMKALKDEPKEK